ncbi:MAG: HD domain-containing phosphohydrolase [Pseudomonadota bacterium]
MLDNKAAATATSSDDHIESSVYSAHLAQINETRHVLAKEDIFNDRGVLLVKAGKAITPAASRAIAQFKLIKPLQDSITIENEVSANELMQNFSALLAKDGILQSIHARYEMASLLGLQCSHYENLPMLKQKITVMSERMGETFDRTLSCTWLALLIAKEMHLAPTEITNVFLAALAHDIGMLHISPQTLDKKEQLSAEEWRQIQAHVVIGKTILAAIPNIHPSVCLAVLEHHERCDGTGYPFGKIESELSLIGQIIALSDSVIAVYFNRFKPEGRGWRDVLPIIQMNNHAFLYRNYEVLITILRNSYLPVTRAVDDAAMLGFINKIIARNAQIKCWFNEVKEFMGLIGYSHGERKLHALQNVILHVATSVNASGIFQEGLIEYLEQIQNEKLKDSYRHVEDIFLMQEEIVFHLQRLNRMVQTHLISEDKKNAVIKDLLESCVKKSDEYVQAMH